MAQETDGNKAETKPRQATIRYVDRPDCTEIFVDSMTGVLFDGQALRLEFAVTRFDEVKPDAPLTGRRYPACRLALTPAAAMELINRMQMVRSSLVQAGVIKPPAPADAG